MGLLAGLLLRFIGRTAARMPSARLTNSATWSRHCTGRNRSHPGVVFNHAEGLIRADSVSADCATAATSSNRAARTTELQRHREYARYQSPVVRRMILTASCWFAQMRVDGLFDLASFCRDIRQLLLIPPVLWDIESDRGWHKTDR